MKFLNEYYKKTGRMKFLAQAAILTFISDVVNICYVNLYFLPEKITINYMLNIYSLMGADPRMLHPLYLEELRHVMINSMSYVFLGFLFYHILVYFKLSKDSAWARKYVFGYAVTGAILTVFELPLLFGQHFGWALAMLFTTLVYIFAFMGLRYFKKKQEKQSNDAKK